MPYFDRYDICEAYYALEMDWNIGGVLRERPCFSRRASKRLTPYSVGFQLSRMGFKPGLMFKAYRELSDNGREIYDAFVVKHRMCSGCDGACVDKWGMTCDMVLAGCTCASPCECLCEDCVTIHKMSQDME